jgi:hypothetical protein
MGREIRRVVPNWEHPKRQMWRPGRGYVDEYQPMYDDAFAPKMREWYGEWEAWERGDKPADAISESYIDYNGPPPDPAYHRPDWKAEDMTWWQVYETVSEGTPVTPPFATPEELIDYLATNGDFWDQHRGDGPWPRANAEAFVKSGWAPSMIVQNGEVFTARDGVPT